MSEHTREPAVAGFFYPGDAASCRREVDACLAQARPLITGEAPWRFGVVPHAGWAYSGPTAAAVFGSMAAARSPGAPPPTFVLLGAVHVRGVSRPTLCNAEVARWETPVGALEIDNVLAEALVRAAPAGLLARSDGAHWDEHSLEVQLPFIAALMPRARILPIAVPPSTAALTLGEVLGEVLAGRPDVLAVASSDLTHYGPRYHFTPAGRGPSSHHWVESENDREMVDTIVDLRAADVLPLAQARQNACGPGAIAALVGAARALGAERGRLLQYTTSARARPERGGAEDFVGYAGIVIACPS